MVEKSGVSGGGRALVWLFSVEKKRKRGSFGGGRREERSTEEEGGRKIRGEELRFFFL